MRNETKTKDQAQRRRVVAAIREQQRIRQVVLGRKRDRIQAEARKKAQNLMADALWGVVEEIEAAGREAGRMEPVDRRVREIVIDTAERINRPFF